MKDEFVFIFNDVNVLYSETLACTKNSAGILSLKKVFKYNGNITGTHFQNLMENLEAVIGEELGEVCDEVLIHLVVFKYQLIQKLVIIVRESEIA